MELNLSLALLLLLAAASCRAHPGGERANDDAVINLVGEATNILAADVLRSNAASDKNFVFSPLGFSAILAMLGEGARGETAERIGAALHHPADRTKVRAAYETALGRLQGDSALIAPQFKTWLYIYRNNTVQADFRETLRSVYHVEVKEIDRYDSVGWGTNDDLLTSPSGTVVVGNIDPTVTLGPLGSDFAHNDGAVAAEADNSKDIPEFDTLKVNVPSASEDDETRLIDDQQDASKFDEVVEDKQYVEVPVIREEIAAAAAAAAAAATATVAANPDVATKTLVDQVKQEIIADNNQYAPESVRIVEALKTTKAQIQDEAALEIMVAQASADNDSVVRGRHFRIGARHFGGQGTGEVASVLSGNSIVGRRTDSDAASESKLILFNGLYYRGSWATPFQQLRSDMGGNTFYKSDTEKCTVNMMRARGQFKYARLEKDKAQAIELPYDNSRYALLIVLPNSRTGLAALQSAWTDQSIHSITAQLITHPTVDLSVPKFHVDTTGGIESILSAPRSTGSLSTLFTEQADFGGITEQQRLHVEELQQHVSVRVDEGTSSENFLTATQALRSTAAIADADDNGPAMDADKQLAVVVDRPFLFFVRDVIDDVLIVAGKVVSPPENDEPAVLLEN